MTTKLEAIWADCEALLRAWQGDDNQGIALLLEQMTPTEKDRAIMGFCETIARWR